MAEERENSEPARQNAIGIRGQEKSKSTGNAPGERRDEAQPPPRRATSAASHAILDEPQPYHDIGTWVWVRHKSDGPGGNDKLQGDEHHAAQVTGMTATGRTQVKWAVGGPQFAPELAHFQGELNGRELEMVFDGSTSADGPHNGRGISKTKVGDLLAQVPNLESLESLGIARSRDDKGTRTFAELRVGPGDEGLKGKTALRWLVDSESNFSPGMIATGKSVVAPSSLPKKTMYGKPENSAAPTYANCVGALCRVLKLLDDDRNDPAFQKLHTLFYCLPSLLLRVPKDVPHRKKTKIIESNCERFLRGKWKSLFMEAAKACSVQPRGFLAPGGPAEAPLIDEDGVNRAGMADKARRAEEKAKGGNYSAARRHLCGPGLGTGPDLFQEMQNKFPKAEPPTWPAVEPEIEITDDCFGECLEEELQKALSLDGMIKVARAAPRMAGCDQWGMDLRGIIYPLLLSEGVGSDVYNFFIMARREGYLPRCHSLRFHAL